MEYYISVGITAVAAVLSSVISIPIIKILQLSGYKAKGVAAWLKATGGDLMIRYAALMLFGFITSIVFVGCFSAYEYVRYCAQGFYVLLAAVFAVCSFKSGSANVKYTARAARLFIADAVIMLGLGALVAWATYASVYCQTLVALLAILSPFVAIAANAVMTPFEKLNNKRYVRRAKRLLAEKSPTVIGITGSFGKTTAKNLLAEMLKTKYSVLATPGNYNTPLGVCKTVNDSLSDERVLIAEMGARYRGDIKELCDIAKPRYGIITAIGDMHIETMGSRQAVADTKFELGAALPEDGVLALNGYNADCAALTGRETRCTKRVTGDGGSVKYENLAIGRDGTTFDLVIDGKAHAVKTALLGAHIAELTCVCAEIALELGVSAEDICSAVSSASAVEHRLQLVPTENSSIAVIDDAYNSNPVGANNALDVLKMFDGARVIITPGFVELGALEKPCNTALGAHIAATCDYAYLIGSRAEYIKSGAVSGGMNKQNIRIFSSRDEAVAALNDIAGKKAVLFENDLPDNIK